MRGPINGQKTLYFTGPDDDTSPRKVFPPIGSNFERSDKSATIVLERLGIERITNARPVSHGLS